MTKVLYVRGIDDKLHDQINEHAREKGTSVATILEEAYSEWIKNKQKTPAKHYLILYSDENSLQVFLKKIKTILEDEYVKACCGPPSHTGVDFLKKRGWFDVNISSYAQGIKKPEQYSAKVFDNLANISKGKLACFVGFMTEDIAQRFSLSKANEIENIYNSKKIGGVVFCPYNVSKLTNYNLGDLLNLFEKHDKVFVIKQNEIFEINAAKTSYTKLFV